MGANQIGKRSKFPKVPKDQYQTIDKRAVEALLPFLPPKTVFVEPCVGQGKLLIDLEYYGHECVWWSDIEDQGFADTVVQDALALQESSVEFADMIITNPAWSRPILHKLIPYLFALKPTWLLFDADWCHTKQSSELMKHCTDIVSVGRLIWIPGTRVSGKDNCAWYRFDNIESPTIFHGRK